MFDFYQAVLVLLTAFAFLGFVGGIITWCAVALSDLSKAWPLSLFGLGVVSVFLIGGLS